MEQVKDRMHGEPAGVPGIISRIIDGITGLFRPEEVEVTFKVKGNKVTYTYTKVNVKQVA